MALLLFRAASSQNRAHTEGDTTLHGMFYLRVEGFLFRSAGVDRVQRRSRQAVSRGSAPAVDGTVQIFPRFSDLYVRFIHPATSHREFMPSTGACRTSKISQQCQLL